LTPAPTSDTAYFGEGGQTGRTIQRTHMRGYMFIGAEGRYVPFRYRWVETWFGISVGGVVVADRFIHDSAEPVPKLIGTREFTVRSEGLAVGVQVGAEYLLTENWVLGLSLRADRWILPEQTRAPKDEPSCGSLGDCPTMKGTVAAFLIGATFGYRIAL
jgi:hypothetical protein